MIKDLNMNGQHEKILFIISLPQTAEFEACKDYVSDCINKLSERGVDVCESIHREDLATISQYDIVIIVAHHDTDDDALLLADGKLSMDDFVNSIPEDFSGELDFSSCYSASVMKAIKDRCPNCHIQASIHQTTLALRLMAYPFVVDLINEDENIEYHDAYMKVLDMMLEAASEIPEDEKEDSFVKLGNHISSIYAPSEVKRESSFMIQIILHYDSEKEVIDVIAKGHEPDTIWRGTLFKDLKEGDILSVKITFDSQNVLVLDDVYTKQITVKEDIVEEQFMVKVTNDFHGSSFWTIINVWKDDNWIPTFKFKIIVSDNENKIPANVMMEIPQQLEKTKKPLSNIREADDKHITVTTSNEELLTGEEKMKRIIEAINKVVEYDLILKKQDWAAIYRILHEKGYYSLTMQSFVEIIKLQKFSKRIVPASDSNLRKVAFHNNQQYEYPYWKIVGMNDDEISRLTNLAKSFMSYCKG